MPIATRTFRVFVSSTFEDLKEERNALQRDVFPKLRKLCEQHGARFQAIDLRWGVRDEAALDQQTMEICLREIRRCQATGVLPNFIVLLGDRYGWQPVPARIPAAEFDALLPHIPAGDTRALAQQWYRLDENAIPAEYCLQPRTGEFIDSDAWNPTEQSLGEALARAARATGLPDAELVKYEASATHQEILAGLGETEGDRPHVFGFFRRPAGETDTRLQDLKSYLRDRLPGNIAEFEPGDTAALCDTVYAQLRQVIEAEVKRFEDRPALDLEVEAHDRFAEERCRIFTGRQAVLDTISDYIRGPERRPLVLHCESGSGKSAVMAKASQQYRGPGTVIRRFIGASPESASGHALLTSLCRQIAPGETPVDYAKLEEAFRTRLSAAAAAQPLVLFIDALDQLAAGDPARDVTWLPPELPPHVKVILSTTGVGERLPEGVPLRLERMAHSEGGQALDAMLHESRRTLQPSQRKTVMAHFERCGLPLYLKLAAEESKLWKSYASEDLCALGEGVPGVIDTLLDRLKSNANHGAVLVEHSLGYLASARYGLTEDEVLDVLTADDAVWNDFDQRKHHEVSERRLPMVVWSRLSLDLESYLTERSSPGGTVIAFYHRQLAERVGVGLHAELARYFLGRSVSDTRRLVELPFQQRGAGQWKEAEATLLDAPFLFAKIGAGMVVDLEADYQALLQEAPESGLTPREALRLIHSALRLSIHVVAREPGQFASQMVGRLLMLQDNPSLERLLEQVSTVAPSPWLRPLHRSLDAPAGSVIRTLTGRSDLVNTLAVTPDGRRAVSGNHDGTMTLWDLDTGTELRSFALHSSWVSAVVVTPDGSRAVSASQDGSIKVWDIGTTKLMGTLIEHSSSVNAANPVALLAGGRYLLSASRDNAVRVWDLESMRETHRLAGHSHEVLAIASAPDGRRVLSGAADGTVIVWDPSGWRIVHQVSLRMFPWLEPKLSDGVMALAVLPDCRRGIVGCADGNTAIIDLQTGTWRKSSGGHVLDLPVMAVAAFHRVNHAISASADGTLRIWKPDESGPPRVLGRVAGCVKSVSISADDRKAASLSVYSSEWGWPACTLRVWSLLGERDELQSPPGHRGPVNSIAVLPGDHKAVSASDDGTIKVWDLSTGIEERTSDDAFSRIQSVTPFAEGGRAISSTDEDYLVVWDIDKGRRLHKMRGGHSQAFQVSVHPDGRRAISASGANYVLVWDLETGVHVGSLSDRADSFYTAAFLSGGRLVLSGSAFGNLTVWDFATGRPIRTIGGRAGAITRMSVSPDERWAVTDGGLESLTLWDLEDGQEVRSINLGHRGRLRALAALPGPRRAVWVVEGGRDVHVVDFLTGEQRSMSPPHSRAVNSVAVSKDGSRVFSASSDGTLVAWDLDRSASIAGFTADGPLSSCALGSDACTVVAGEFSGRVHVLHLQAANGPNPCQPEDRVVSAAE